ncbi:MAG: penicillin acylase family protein [Candidatus Kapabacteria bacterium]|nr:penicillin acylase family protein [Candidatus Kapabacteria bacterium]MDW8012327.1 penicillin acylase family protein [Bacteroidota bacterium]
MLWRFVLPLLGVAIIVALSLGIGGWFFLSRSLPLEFAIVRVAVQDSVVVWRDSFAIPTIRAAHTSDAFFALGYLHAEDRLWQMDILRRIALGRVAELVGEEALPLDYLMRTLGFGRMAQRLWENLHPISRSILRRYAEGVNAWLQQNARRLPPEFLILGYHPEPWTPQHSLAIARLMAFDLAFCFWSDIAVGAIAEEIGVEKAWDLLPGYPSSAPTIVGKEPANFPPPNGSRSQHPTLPPPPYGFSELASLRTALLPWLRPAAGQGSNAWAVRTRTGAVLANDPHLVLGLPARWYPVCILSPDYEVAGLTLPGLPLVIIGRNRFIAWGVTNLMADESDFVLEQIDSTAPTRYWDGKQWRRFQRQRDTIHVRGRPPMVIEILRSHNGPIISDVHLFAAPAFLFRRRSDTSTNPLLRRYRLSYRWAADTVSDEVLAAYRIGRARSLSQFRSALRTWVAPVLCFVYADHRGTIAAQAAGLVPIRDSTAPEQTWAFPLKGWEPQYWWRGLLQALELPSVANPKQGFVVSANNQLAPQLPFPLTYIWEPHSRAERLTELLSQYGADYTLSDAERMQIDVVSPYARNVLKVVLPLLEERQPRSRVEQHVLDSLRSWDCHFGRSSVGASIFAILLQRLLVNTFGQHLSPPRLREYLFLSNLALRRLWELLPALYAAFFDDPRTQRRETLRDILHRSFVEAIDTLRHRLGNDISSWRYERLHQLHLEHPLGLHPLLRPLFSRGPYPTPGAPTTVNTGEWRLWEPFRQMLGASARFIADLADSTWAVALPGGVSGHFLSHHYTDQLPLWLYGATVRRPLGISKTDRLSLVFVPSRSVPPPVSP